VPLYQVSFYASDVNVRTESDLDIVIEIESLSSVVRGVVSMDYQVEASSPAFRLRARGKKRFSGTFVDLPDVEWTGTGTTLATCAVEPDGTVLVTPKDTPGTFTLSPRSPSLPELPPGVANITLTEEGIASIEVEVVPV
jgi:hypothetical protein